MKKIFIVILAILVFFPNLTFGKIVTSEKHEYYILNIENLASIEQALFLSGLRDINGHIYAASTKSKFIWKYNPEKSGNTCSIKSINVEVQVTYKLPKLSNYKNLELSDKLKWQTYFDALYKHEQGHANISTDIAKKIKATAKLIPPQNNCSKSKRLANIKIAKLLESHEKRNKIYDKITNHGIIQGATILALK